MASDVVVFDQYVTLLLWRVVTLRSTAVSPPELNCGVCVCGLYAYVQTGTGYSLFVVAPRWCRVVVSSWRQHVSSQEGGSG